MVYIVRPRDRALAGREQRVAAQSGGGGNGTAERKRLAVFERERPVGRPAAQNGVEGPAAPQVAASRAERQLILPDEMDHVMHIEAARSVIRLHAEACQVRR